MPPDRTIRTAGDDIADLLARLDTRPYQQADRATRVLVAFNISARPFVGVAAFDAAYPVRVPPGPLPVTITNVYGRTVPSRLVNGRLGPETTDTAGTKRLWSFRLEILVEEPIPPRTAVAWAAAYAIGAEREVPGAEWTLACAAGALRLYETDIHAGDLLIPLPIGDLLPGLLPSD
jgi:hypothetical protein